MRVDVPIEPDGTGLCVAIVASRYHDDIVQRLAEGAAAAFVAAGGRGDDLIRVEAPGTFELPVIASHLARSDDVHAVVCVGLVLTGETLHDRYLSDSVAHALQDLALETGKPVAFGILTCQSMEQAHARSGGAKGNKGDEAMRAALVAVAAIRAYRGAMRRAASL